MHRAVTAISGRGVALYGSRLPLTALDTIRADFALLDDWEDRYRYVIELGRALPPLPDALRTEANKVRGCASQVWLASKVRASANETGPVFEFQGDSDAHIVRGLIAILFAICTARAFEMPIMHAIVPDIVQQLILPRAIAASATAQQTAIICGPAIGGVLYLLGPVAVYVLCAVVFVTVKGWSALVHLNFFTDDMSGVGPKDGFDKGGVLHAVIGSLIQVGIAVAITLPLGIGTASFAAVDSPEELTAALRLIGQPAVLKTRRFGYDGKGQAMIRNGGDPVALFNDLGGQPQILEAFVPFEKEVSVVAARGRDGQIESFEVTENEHQDHILKTSRVPAAGSNSSPAFDTAATCSSRQSSSPTDASEKRLSSGGVSLARASVTRAARSDPNQGRARAPFAGLRLVATSSVGLDETAAASKRGAFAESAAQPSSAKTDTADVSRRNAARRDTAIPGRITPTR